MPTGNYSDGKESTSTRQDGLGKDGCPSGFKRDPVTGKCVQKGVDDAGTWRP